MFAAEPKWGLDDIPQLDLDTHSKRVTPSTTGDETGTPHS
jgi:hypothetical protein